jgi:hypothetical protein
MEILLARLYDDGLSLSKSAQEPLPAVKNIQPATAGSMREAPAWLVACDWCSQSDEGT